MITVKVLVPGYAKVNPDGTWDATCTTTLILAGIHKIIMDPGCNRQLLLPALHKENLEVGDIDMVFLSHHHPDHAFLAGIFTNATVIDSLQWQKDSIAGDHQYTHLPGTDIQIIKTPGHTPDHASLLVPTADGQVLIAADVFWWSEGEEQKVDINKPDPFASDQQLLTLSRSAVLSLPKDHALTIIPGHGKTFSVSKP